MTYAAGDTLVRAIMQASTGLPADQIVNDWAFYYLAGAPDAAAYQDVEDVVSGFYRDTQANTHAVGEYISPYVDRAATHELASYQMAYPTMGSPAHTSAWLGPVTPAAANPFPAECAAVLSFQADYTGILEHSGTTRPRASRRGRVYIGPLMTNALETTTPPYMLDTTFLQTLRQAAIAMRAAAELVGWRWVVWSRKLQTVNAVVGGWTDNAPDTQRRRGPKASTRVTYTV